MTSEPLRRLSLAVATIAALRKDRVQKRATRDETKMAYELLAMSKGGLVAREGKLLETAAVGPPELSPTRPPEGQAQPFDGRKEDVANHTEDMPMTIARRLVESQFVRFCAVGASGYVVNLAAYAALLAAGLHYLAASAIAFLVAAGSNYVWNRTWTFQTSDAPVLRQGARALVVSALSLGANQLFLFFLVASGAGHLAGQAVAIALATPFSFAANKLWAFSDLRHAPKPRLLPVTVRSRDR